MREKYHRKENKKRFFYPEEWQKFYELLKEEQQPYFKIARNTGGRINEIRNVKAEDIDFERKTLTFKVTKVRAKKKERKPTPRTIPISSELSDWLERWIRKYKLKPNDKFSIPSTTAIKNILNNKLQEIGVKDWEEFSSHNVRKTFGTWLLALGVDGVAVAVHMGHDVNTMVNSYVSPNVFTEKDRILMKNELGDLIDRFLVR